MEKRGGTRIVTRTNSIIAHLHQALLRGDDPHRVQPAAVSTKGQVLQYAAFERGSMELLWPAPKECSMSHRQCSTVLEHSSTSAVFWKMQPLTSPVAGP